MVSLVWSSVPDSCNKIDICQQHLVSLTIIQATRLFVLMDHSLGQCLTYIYLVPLMSSLHQLEIVLCHLHEEKLVAGEPFLTTEYMSQPFPE